MITGALIVFMLISQDVGPYIEPTKSANRVAIVDGKQYTVEYIYKESGYKIPLTVNPQHHYHAKISVYRNRGKSKRLIGQPFHGYYTEKGCFEDNPETLIRYALKEGKR